MNDYPNGHNVGPGWIPCKKGCTCTDCQIESLIAQRYALKKRIAELELAQGRANDEIGVYDICQVPPLVESLRARVAELEAAQERPASEPPENSRHVLLAIEWTDFAGKRARRWCLALHLKSGEEEYWGDDDNFGHYDSERNVVYCTAGWYEFRNNEDDYLFIVENELVILGWRELPKMPEQAKEGAQ